MTYEYVDVGTSPDDGNGDPLRTAYIKINNNFAHLQQVGTDQISNGSSNVSIPTANGNIYMGVGNVSNVLIITSNAAVGSTLSATGNVVAGNYFLGDGGLISNISGAKTIVNGTSNVSIPTLDGNINSVVQGNLTMQVSPQLVTVFGDLNITGNATLAGNITRNAISYGTSFLGFGTADGNANVTIAGTSNVAVFTTTGLSVAGIINGGTVTGGLISTAGNVQAANVVGTTVSASGNVQGNNIVGNQGVYGNIFTTLIDSGDSSQITVTPDVRFSATVTVDNELDVSMILAQRINTNILSASGNVLGPIPSVSNTFYVAKNGRDSNDGGLNTPFLTIKQACTAAQAAGGNVAIRVASGTYVEQNPITIPANTALMGDNLRTVQVKPATPAGDLFYMSGGTYVWGLTVRDYLGAAFSYNPSTVTTAYVSPYIQNITSYTTTGTGVRIDGSKAIGTKAMIVGFYTIINRGGIGIDISNSGYSQLVNIYTIACDIGIRTQSGAFCTLNGSDCSIGNYGLISTGVGPLQTSGKTIGYSTAGTFAIGTLGNGQPHVNTVMLIDGDPTYYTIDTILPNTPAAGNATVLIQEVYTGNLAPNTNVAFYTRSAIIASAHTFEYVGAGTDPATALPQYGGIPIQANEVIATGGGVVTFTSTDQKGNFRVGKGFTVNQATGTVSGDDFYRSLFAIMTPYILALQEVP
jgi:hypothetical protein